MKLPLYGVLVESNVVNYPEKIKHFIAYEVKVKALHLMTFFHVLGSFMQG